MSRGCHSGATTRVHHAVTGFGVTRETEWCRRGRSRRSTGGARPPGGPIGDWVGAESPLSFEHQVAYGGPGGSPYATAGCGGADAVLGSGPFERASAAVRRGPATIGSGADPGSPAGRKFVRPDALTLAYGPARVTLPSERPPLALRQPKETLRRSNSSGTVLWDTRHQHRQDRCVPGRSLKTE